MRAFLTTAAAALVIAAATPAAALTINLLDQSGAMPNEVRDSYQAAAQYWQSVLTNDATVNIDITFDPTNVSTYSTLSTRSTDVRAWEALVQATRSNDALDQGLVLPTISRGGVTFITNAAPENPGYYDGSETARRMLLLNTALGKALGDVRIDPDTIDGTIYLGGPNYDFDPRDGVAANKVDVLGVMLHEIGHILGFTSGVDAVGQLGPWAAAHQPVFSALDMFRYSMDYRSQAPGYTPVLDFTFGQSAILNPYFSIDGGQTALFGNMLSNGQPYQSSHWDAKPCGLEFGLMDPTYCDGDNARKVSALDLAALDAIGWNLNLDPLADPRYRMSTAEVFDQYMSGSAGVPEPSTWALFILGFGLVGSRMRRNPVGRGVRPSGSSPACP